MDLSLTMSAQDLLAVNREVDAFNKTLSSDTTKKPTASMDKNDFLKILITQLSHQDPTQPLGDKEFIAQMAQFSSLEQITNMSEALTKVADLVTRSQALSLLGANVDVADGQSLVSGIVDAVTAGDYPQLMVNGKYYDYSQVQKIRRTSTSAEAAGGAAHKE